MHRLKRKLASKILNSGWSCVNIVNRLSLLLQQPEADILRIIQNHHWDRDLILNSFNMFCNSYKEPVEYLKIYSAEWYK
jgi:hypothetical protein